ncbi:MAG: hypothetical protein KGR47_13245, partial [Acidobacteria bacterium]|nr:hypothetical protein [Acidobacteriota bacterium]
AFIEFGRTMLEDESARPAWLHTHWKGRFLDLSVLASALTGSRMSLQTACEAFEVPGKADIDSHGVITPAYIDYCRQDVAATAGLYVALMAEYSQHDVVTPPEQLHSAASLSKGYYQSMGITPVLQRHREFDPARLGQSMAAFFGGRAECKLRLQPMPVSLNDVTSMYPSVCANLDLHTLNTAATIDTVDCTAELTELLDNLTLDDCLNRDLWKNLIGFALIEPAGDLLPVRGLFNGLTFTIADTHLHCDRPQWYALPDILATTLRTGTPPKIITAHRYTGIGTLDTLKPVSVRGNPPIDPRTGDPILAMSQMRQLVKADTTVDPDERARREASLKLIINAGSYGIFSEFNQQHPRNDKPTPITVHSRDRSFHTSTPAYEKPGRYCFPPFAAAITAGARLVLAIMEHLVTDLGGAWMFGDTDSMAIIATEHGGLLPCPGGTHTLPDGTPAVLALSREQIDNIRHTLNRLNPYDIQHVPQLLKDEGQAWCYAISVKRYALFTYNDDGSITLIDDGYSETGLGHLLNPIDPHSKNKDWMEHGWLHMLHQALDIDAPEPAWLDKPTIGRDSVSSVHVWKSFATFNQGKPYAEQMKPFNFLMSAAGAKRPPGVPLSQPFRLIAPLDLAAAYNPNTLWTNMHNPAQKVRITTRPGTPDASLVPTFRFMLARHTTHPESKTTDADGTPSNRSTRGQLHRRPVTAGTIALVGKESNKLTERESG